MSRKSGRCCDCERRCKVEIKQYNSNLDVIRVVAAIMVLMVHAGQYVGGKWQEITAFGANGVQIFFVLSGYLIMKSLEHTSSVKKYYLYRVVRIVPLYYIVLCLRYLYDVLWYYFVEGMPLNSIFGGPCGYRYLRYFAFLQMFLPPDNWGFWNNRNALWTMSSFALFYLCAPLIYKWVNKFWKAISLFAISVLALPYWIDFCKKTLEACLSYSEEYNVDWFSEMNPFSKMWIFLLGVVLYHAVKENKMFSLGATVSLLLMMTLFQWHPYELAAVLLIMFAVAFPPVKLNGKIAMAFKYGSQMSFAVYLIHPMVLPIVQHLLADHSLSAMMCMLIYVGSSIVLSGGIYYLIAYPIEKNVRKIAGG